MRDLVLNRFQRIDSQGKTGSARNVVDQKRLSCSGPQLVKIGHDPTLGWRHIERRYDQNRISACFIEAIDQGGSRFERLGGCPCTNRTATFGGFDDEFDELATLLNS